MRFMADPDDGFAPPEWQYGGTMGAAPPVLLARRDRIPFSLHDWDLMNAYISEWLDDLSEAEEMRAQVSERHLQPAVFRNYVRAHRDSQAVAFLPLQFPVGSIVIPEGLKVAELNGVEGEVVRYTRDRVGVRFPDREVMALKPERLKLVRDVPLADPAAKRLDTGDAKEVQKKREMRAKEVAQQEARAIAQRFCEFLYQDTFPEMGDLHLFGVGCDYKSRAQEVLAVWQGAVKSGDLTEERLAEALHDGSMKDLFMETCKKLAKSRNPNQTYAMELIKNNFAALEWDTLE